VDKAQIPENARDSSGDANRAGGRGRRQSGESIEDVKNCNKNFNSSRRAAVVSDILLPSEPEYRLSKHRVANGIPVDDTIWEEIQKTERVLSVKI
jgi:LDH2 family malate/lactate/ureidoglycolate dehydrogenase